MNDSANVMKQYLEAMNGQDIQKIRQLLHPQYSYTGSDGKRQEGIEAGIAVASMYMNAFPDMKLDVKHSYAVGDVVVTEFIGRGTHKGKIMDIAPTGRQVAIPVCNVVEVREVKSTPNVNTLLMQL
jgi:predicted ester cyclase